MNFIVFDLEATCWDQYDKSDNETIEIGALKINKNLEIESEYQKFIKPLKYPILSDFCKKLTTISQAEIDEAGHFYDVIEDFKKWIGRDYVLCSWGYYDQKQFESDCSLSNIEDSWTKKHISIKHQYGDLKKLKRPVGMMKALEIEGLSAGGTHHRGIDDARNISKIFIKYFDDWQFEF